MRLGKSLLAGCPICSSLGEDALVPIAEVALERAFAKDELIFSEGDLCTGFHLVLAGRVRVYKTSSTGKEKVLIVAEAGMTFGEDALFGAGKFMENATALTPVRTLHVPRAEFLAMLRRNPDLGLQVMESLCLWIRRLSTSVENIAFLNARDKVITYLLDLAGPDVGAGAVTFPEKKKDVADRLGLTPETFSRVLHDLEQQGLIVVERRKIGFNHLEALKEALAR